MCGFGERRSENANFPIALIGTDYWRPLQDMLRHLARTRTIDIKDLDLLLVTDQVSAALDHIRRHAIEQFGLVAGVGRPSRLRVKREPPRPDARSVLSGRAV